MEFMKEYKKVKRDFLCNLSKKVVYGLSTIMLFFLIVISFLYTSDGYTIAIHAWKSIATIVLVFITILGIYLVEPYMLHIAENKIVKKYKIDFCIFLLVVLGFCTWWILTSSNLPQSDSQAIYGIAVRAKNNDLTTIVPKGSYMSFWPHQSGLVLFEEFFLRLFPNLNEIRLQLLYLPFMGLSLVSLYEILKRFFKKSETIQKWIIFMFFCLPYYLYINNMYGEIPSMSMLFFGIWMLIKYLESRNWISLFLMLCAFIGAISVRKNSLIFMIACFLVVFVWTFAQKKEKSDSRIFTSFITIGVLVVSVIAGSIVPKAIYEKRANNTMGPGVPAISYLAMGFQWSEGRDAGAWNGYHSDLYMATDYDFEKTKQISTDNFKESVSYMLQHPTYALSFFYNKLLSQWGREDFSCLHVTLTFYGERIDASWKNVVMTIMIVFQSIVYVGAFFYTLTAYRRYKEEDILSSILLVTFIGGFFFSLLWEGGSRYVMPYFVILIPYSAEGYTRLKSYIQTK